MYLADYDIAGLAYGGMIHPYEPTQIRRGVSYGQSCAGYDVRLSPIFKAPKPAIVLDPHEISEAHFSTVEADSYEIPPGAFVLANTAERFIMPQNVLGIALGKSTWARLGLVVNATPLEPGWRGFLTLELSNTGRNVIRVHAGEGIAQILFAQLSGFPAMTYSRRAGKYMDQPAEPVISKL